jgi:hypothetical protein
VKFTVGAGSAAKRSAAKKRLNLNVTFTKKGTLSPSKTGEKVKKRLTNDT